MATRYEDIETLIPNTTMKKFYINEVFRTYNITPIDGYVLHDNTFDINVYDEMTGEPTGEVLLGYRPTMASCGYNYDFTPVEMQDDEGNTVTAYGSRQFFAKLASEVPENQIFGVTEPEHEIM